MTPDRHRRILRTVIEAYVADGAPVSSSRVRDLGGFSMSTASIRSRMADLERDGYLAKTHASSGRVPTDAGYRLYVEELQASPREREEIAARCRSQLRRDTHEVEEIMLHASEFLAEVSRNVSVVYGAIERQSRVRSLQLVRLEANRLLAVVNLVPQYERTTTLHFDRDFSLEIVTRSQELIDRIVSDKTLDQARAALESVVRDNVTDEGVITREVSLHKDELLTAPPDVDFYFEERRHLLDHPELSDPRTLQLILRVLHDKEYLTSILSRRWPDRTQVTIGDEHADEALRPFSVVTAGYRMGVARGVLGVIGPTRMRYDVVLSLVEAVSRELRAIGEEYFRR